jgi:predicted esterase
MVPIVPSTSPDLKQVSVLIAAGKRDAIANSQETQRLVQIREDAGGAVTMFWHKGDHELGQDDLDTATSWESEWRASE